MTLNNLMHNVFKNVRGIKINLDGITTKQSKHSLRKDKLSSKTT